MTAKPRSRLRKWMFPWGLLVLLAVAVGGAVWCWWVYGQIEHWANIDEAAPSDAIAVLGAAEYDGRPSPVYRARLDHAESLYNRGIAPLIITLGGDGGDRYSEGGVGRAYLVGAGVPESSIIAETHSRSTMEAVDQLAVIARANGYRRLVVVSDDTHMFRLHAMCAAIGLNVLTSPRAKLPVAGEVTDTDADRITHEILSYTAWRLHLE